MHLKMHKMHLPKFLGGRRSCAPHSRVGGRVERGAAWPCHQPQKHPGEQGGLKEQEATTPCRGRPPWWP